MRRQNTVLALLLLASTTADASSPGTSVIVTIRGIETPSGAAYVSLCREAEFLTPECYRTTGRKITKSGSYIFSFEAVEPGTYAVLAWHDVNGNKTLDRNSYGAPTEPTGVSGDGAQAGQLPQFARSSFVVASDTVNLSIGLR